MKVKRDPENLKQCIAEDDGWAERPRTGAIRKVCPFGVEEWRIPIWHRGEYHGTVFVGSTGEEESDRMPTEESCMSLARLIADLYSRYQEQQWEQELGRRAESDPVVAKAMEWIRQQGRVNIRVPDAARVVALSPSRFLHRFHECMDIGFGECVRLLAMERALQLVTGTDLRIVEISLELGYANQNHFAQHFKSTHGCTATQARRKAKLALEGSYTEG